MTLLVDNRAGSKELWKYQCIRDIGVLSRLDSADVAFTGNGPDGDVLVGIEVKRFDDLMASAASGRLQGTQIPTMLKAYDVNYILHYGVYRARPEDYQLQTLKKGMWRLYRAGTRTFTYGYVEGLLMTLQAVDIRIKRCPTEAEAALYIAVLYRWWQKKWSAHKGLHAFDDSGAVNAKRTKVSGSRALLPDIDEDTLRRARIAKQFTGVGYDRAIAVAKAYESVSAMLDAGAAGEWKDVDGIGKTVAASVSMELLRTAPFAGARRAKTKTTSKVSRTK